MPLPQPLTQPAAELISQRFRLLAEPMRVRILDRLRTGEANVHELAEGLGTTPQNVSKHLGVLAGEGIVARRKVGNFAYYHVVDDGIWQLCHLVCAGIEQRLDSLRLELAPTAP
jgi:DNA-binding transcriptional ArsR family regulator